MHLVLFDIDGTLTESYDVDTRVYAATMREVLDVDWETVAWRDFEDVTDPRVARAVIAQELGRAATVEDLEAMEACFVRLLAEAARDEPEAFRPVAGVEEVLAELRGRDDTALAIATGAWRRSAEIKLRTAGLEVDDLPLATSSDAERRTEIMTRAMQEAATRHGEERFASRVYVGDGIWDVRAAGELEFHLIGIGRGENAEHLRRAGAETVFGDYTDRGAFFAALSRMQDGG